MFRNLLKKIGQNSVSEKAPTRRRHPRRECDSCVGIIMGRTFPVQDWSQGGMLLTADDRLFSIGGEKRLISEQDQWIAPNRLRVIWR